MNPEFHFAFSRHAPEFAASIAGAVAACDVIAFEYPNVTSQTQMRYGQLYSAYAQLPHSLRQATYDRVDPHGGNWVANTLRDLPLEGRHVVLLDITTDHPDYRQVEISHQAYKELKEGLNNSRIPITQLRGLYRSYLQSAAVADQVREKLVIHQLLDLAPRVGAMTIGVVCGAIHTPIRRQIAAEGYTTTAQFVGINHPRHLPRGKKAQFSYAMQAIRRLNLEPQLPLDEMCINRIILSDLFKFADLFLPSDRPATAMELTAVDETVEIKVINQLSDAQVAGVLDDIDRHRAIPQTAAMLQESIARVLTPIARDCKAI